MGRAKSRVQESGNLIPKLIVSAPCVYTPPTLVSALHCDLSNDLIFSEPQVSHPIYSEGIGVWRPRGQPYLCVGLSDNQGPSNLSGLWGGMNKSIQLLTKAFLH